MLRNFLLLSSTILLLFSALLSAQTKGVNRDKYRIHISETNEVINVDGILDEKVWQSAERSGQFQRVLPTDTGYAAARTDVRLNTLPWNNLL